MSELKELIKGLPEEIQAMILAHADTIINMKFDELQQLMQQIVGKHFNGAYETLNKRLTPAERLTEQDRLNAMIVLYNRQNKSNIDMWRDFFITLITILIQEAKNEIVE